MEITQSELPRDLRAGVSRYLMGLGKSGQLLEQATPLDYVWGSRATIRCGSATCTRGCASSSWATPLASNLRSSSRRPLTCPAAGTTAGEAASLSRRKLRLRAFGGPRVLRPGESVSFRFELLLTPCDPST